MASRDGRYRTGIICGTLYHTTAANGRNSPSQKGVLPQEGCHKHNFVLQETIREASTAGELEIAWLDLSNAFGSVPYETISETAATRNVFAEANRLALNRPIYTNKIVAWLDNSDYSRPFG